MTLRSRKWLLMKESDRVLFSSAPQSQSRPIGLSRNERNEKWWRRWRINHVLSSAHASNEHRRRDVELKLCEVLWAGEAVNVIRKKSKYSKFSSCIGEYWHNVNRFISSNLHHPTQPLSTASYRPRDSLPQTPNGGYRRVEISTDTIETKEAPPVQPIQATHQPTRDFTIESIRIVSQWIHVDVISNSINGIFDTNLSNPFGGKLKFTIICHFQIQSHALNTYTIAWLNYVDGILLFLVWSFNGVLWRNNLPCQFSIVESRQRVGSFWWNEFSQNCVIWSFMCFYFRRSLRPVVKLNILPPSWP